MAKDSLESPPRPRGRPRIDDEPLSNVSTRLPAPYHDRLCQLAKKQDTSVSAIVRQLLVLRLR